MRFARGWGEGMSRDGDSATSYSEGLGSLLLPTGHSGHRVLARAPEPLRYLGDKQWKEAVAAGGDGGAFGLLEKHSQ